MLPAHPQMTGDLIITLSDYERRETCPRAAKRFDGFRDRRPPWQVRTHIQARISTLQCWLICMHAHAGACTHIQTHARTNDSWRPARPPARTHTRTHTRTHARTHTGRDQGQVEAWKPSSSFQVTEPHLHLPRPPGCDRARACADFQTC